MSISFKLSKLMNLQEGSRTVTPAEPVLEVGSRGAGVQKYLEKLDSSLLGNDKKDLSRTFSEFANYMRKNATAFFVFSRPVVQSLQQKLTRRVKVS